MSAFKNPIFIKEFAYRTMVNYYNFKNIEVSEKVIPEVKPILDEMHSNGFDTSQKYEVTLAINSMVGLLIFPEQNYYNDILNEKSFDNLPILKECIENEKCDYLNTYVKISRERIPIKEEVIPVNILNHMRNSLAHEHIMIKPQSTDGKNITGITFGDSSIPKGYSNISEKIKIKLDKNIFCGKFKQNANGNYYYKNEFRLTIPVEKLEGVLMEIANYLIDKASK